jgi:hypothetical protein
VNRIRRPAVLLGLTAAVVVGSSIPAAATFTEAVSTNTGVLRTATVVAPTGLVVDDVCTTTTTTVKRTVYTNPTTGAQSTTSYSSTTTTSASSTDQDGTTTSTVAGPGANESTTTTVTKDTDLTVTLRWTASPSRGVNAYVVTAHLGIDGSTSPLLSAPSGTTSVTQTHDASALSYRASLTVTAQTTYGWTATSAQTRVLSC